MHTKSVTGRAARAGPVVTSAMAVAEHRVDDALAILAHELRGPLAAMQNSIELIRTLAASERCALPCAVMERQVARMARLIDDLADMSRIHQGGWTLQSQNVDVAGFIGDAVETSGPLIRELGHVLSVDVPGHPLRVRGDPVRLTQVLANLLDNAAKYTPRGGRIRVEASPDEGDAVISVSDTGVGIQPAMLEQIFEMYARGPGAPAGPGGRGIGLALVKRLVELHGGTVRARSGGADTGATFVVRLPTAGSPDDPCCRPDRALNTAAR
jgi:signal transduction histidine kinase